ncbi:hypothetical protein C5167_038527 [Papaver somniferum]|uniref:Uncharacterized protein n=1 Tax=Papaver somniferum TaxID=3469 RepID=A0A4Y7IC17_PAPSO|nr:hypothetical protein C5167_038527 [Papaver somniferum]
MRVENLNLTGTLDECIFVGYRENKSRYPKTIKRMIKWKRYKKRKWWLRRRRFIASHPVIRVSSSLTAYINHLMLFESFVGGQRSFKHRKLHSGMASQVNCRLQKVGSSSEQDSFKGSRDLEEGKHAPLLFESIGGWNNWLNRIMSFPLGKYFTVFPWESTLEWRIHLWITSLRKTLHESSDGMKLTKYKVAEVSIKMAILSCRLGGTEFRRMCWGSIIVWLYSKK